MSEKSLEDWQHHLGKRRRDRNAPRGVVTMPEGAKVVILEKGLNYIRILPAKKGVEPYSNITIHRNVGGAAGRRSMRCLGMWKTKCPACDRVAVLYNQGTEAAKKAARDLKAKEFTVWNVVKFGLKVSPKNPPGHIKPVTQGILLAGVQIEEQIETIILGRQPVSRDEQSAAFLDEDKGQEPRGGLLHPLRGFDLCITVNPDALGSTDVKYYTVQVFKTSCPILGLKKKESIAAILKRCVNLESVVLFDKPKASEMMTALSETTAVDWDQEAGIAASKDSVTTDLDFDSIATDPDELRF